MIRNKPPTKFLKPLETRCFCCERPLTQDEHGTIYDAGYAEIAFHYGSSFDQCHGFGGRQDNMEGKDPFDLMLASDIIEAYICDSCFKRKYHLCNGYIREGLALENKVEQHANLIELASWFNSDEGKKEWEEAIARSRAEEEEAEQKGWYDI